MRGNPVKVLLIEDNPGDARLICEMLADSRDALIELDYVDSLSSGLERLAAGGIDVLLLDLSLPDGQGLDVCVRAHTQAQQVPIVVLTGLDDETMAVKALQVGAQDYLIKGQVDSRLLLRSIRYAIERKQAQEQLQHSQLLASLGEMTAGIAHEVNNPLGSILLYSELLMSSDVPSQTRKSLKVIHDEAKRAAKIMTDLLTYGQRMRPQMRRLNLHGILKKVLAMRRYQERVQNITTSTNLPNGPLYVKGDSCQLMQVFINLMLNAEEVLRESNGGNILVTTQVDGEWVKISIADDGIGIPQENLNQVFHPFSTTKRVGEGTGLGLSICYGIVTGHNGLIYAENNEMGGATFTVELPLAEIRDMKTPQETRRLKPVSVRPSYASTSPIGNMLYKRLPPQLYQPPSPSTLHKHRDW